MLGPVTPAEREPISGLTTPAGEVDTYVPSEDNVAREMEYHHISATIHHDGAVTVRHARIDLPSRRLVTEQLTSPPAVESGPWSWEEVLMLAAMELLERRVAEESVVPW